MDSHVSSDSSDSREMYYDAKEANIELGLDNLKINSDSYADEQVKHESKGHSLSESIPKHAKENVQRNVSDNNPNATLQLNQTDMKKNTRILHHDKDNTASGAIREHENNRQTLEPQSISMAHHGKHTNKNDTLSCFNTGEYDDSILETKRDSLTGGDDNQHSYGIYTGQNKNGQTENSNKSKISNYSALALHGNKKENSGFAHNQNYSEDQIIFDRRDTKKEKTEQSTSFICNTRQTMVSVKSHRTSNELPASPEVMHLSHESGNITKCAAQDLCNLCQNGCITYICYECGSERMCSECTTLHSRMKITANHTPKRVDMRQDARKNEKRECFDHIGSHISHVCETCHKFLCDKCIRDGSHSEHKLLDISQDETKLYNLAEKVNSNLIYRLEKSNLSAKLIDMKKQEIELLNGNYEEEYNYRMMALNQQIQTILTNSAANKDVADANFRENVETLDTMASLNHRFSQKDLQMIQLLSESLFSKNYMTVLEALDIYFKNEESMPDKGVDDPASINGDCFNTRCLVSISPDVATQFDIHSYGDDIYKESRTSEFLREWPLKMVPLSSFDTQLSTTKLVKCLSDKIYDYLLCICFDDNTVTLWNVFNMEELRERKIPDCKQVVGLCNKQFAVLSSKSKPINIFIVDVYLETQKILDLSPCVERVHLSNTTSSNKGSRQAYDKKSQVRMLPINDEKFIYYHTRNSEQVFSVRRWSDGAEIDKITTPLTQQHTFAKVGLFGPIVEIAYVASGYIHTVNDKGLTSRIPIKYDQPGKPLNLTSKDYNFSESSYLSDQSFVFSNQNTGRDESMFVFGESDASQDAQFEDESHTTTQANITTTTQSKSECDTTDSKLFDPNTDTELHFKADVGKRNMITARRISGNNVSSTDSLSSGLLTVQNKLNVISTTAQNCISSSLFSTEAASGFSVGTSEASATALNVAANSTVNSTKAASRFGLETLKWSKDIIANTASSTSTPAKPAPLSSFVTPLCSTSVATTTVSSTITTSKSTLGFNFGSCEFGISNTGTTKATNTKTCTRIKSSNSVGIPKTTSMSSLGTRHSSSNTDASNIPFDVEFATKLRNATCSTLSASTGKDDKGIVLLNYDARNKLILFKQECSIYVLDIITGKRHSLLEKCDSSYKLLDISMSGQDVYTVYNKGTGSVLYKYKLVFTENKI